MTEKFELMEADGLGWFGYRDWGVAGEYFFKSYQPHYNSGLFTGVVRPSPFFTGAPNIEYYASRKDLEEAIMEAPDDRP
jgi:hypothetical protein